MDPLVFQGGANFLSSLMNNVFARSRQKREFRDAQRMSELAFSRDKEMWNLQTDWNRKMWDLQNEYNLPANQMQRLRDAGLNPNLIYGTGAAGGQAAQVQRAEMPKYQAARPDYSWDPIGVPNILGMYQDYQIRSAQLDNVQAQADLTRERAASERAYRPPRTSKYWSDSVKAEATAMYSHTAREVEVRQQRRNLEKTLLDLAIKEQILGRTKALRGLSEKELEWMTGFSGARPQDLTRFLEQVLRMYFSRK